VIGVLVTLVATGVWGSGSSSTATPPATLPVPTEVAATSLYRAVSKIALHELGPADPGQKGSRLVYLHLFPAQSVLIRTGATPDLQEYRSPYLEFNLYDNPLGKAWRLRTAESDVFRLLRALYTSGLPIYNVQLVGWFPVSNGKTVKNSKVLVALMDYFTAESIPWKRWGREHEAQVWKMLTYKSVDPRFG